MNIANLITTVRLVMIPAVVYAALSGEVFLAAVLFAFAAFTDWLDGKFARGLNAATDFGKLYDPLVDRLLILSILAAFIIKDMLPLSIVLVVIIRDLLILLGAYFARSKGLKIEVTYLGKLTTALIMVSVPLVMIDFALGAPLFYFAALLSLASFGDYLLKLIGSRKLLWKSQ